MEGERHGRWVRRFADGAVQSEGPYEDDKQHGKWTVYYGDEPRRSREGPYLNGERHGKWIDRNEDGRVVYERQFVNGRLHGPYVGRNEEGRVTERGQYEDWERHGKWVTLDEDGDVRSTREYVHGKEARPVWESEYRDSHDTADADGHTRRTKVEPSGKYENGEKVGSWYEIFDDHCNARGEYARHENTWVRHGHWELFVAPVGKWARYELEGPYV